MRRVNVTTAYPSAPPVVPAFVVRSPVHQRRSTRVAASRGRGRGRPSRKRSRAGRPKQLPPPPPPPVVSNSPLKPPPFVPKCRGRRFVPRIGEGCILIRGTKHYLRSGLPSMPRNSTCKVCYLAGKVENRTNGGTGRVKKPRRTTYACDKCRRMLCPTCFRKQTSHGSLESVRAVLLIK